MKKFILFLITVIFFQTAVFAEEIPPRGCGYSITKETNPIYFGYMEDYAKLLKAELEKSRMFRLRGMGASYYVTIARDQKIKDIKISTPSPYKYFNKRIENIILSVEPPPFREGMEMDKMLFDIYLGYEKYDDIDLGIGYAFRFMKNVFDMIITTSK